MIHVKSTTADYRPEQVRSRYVRADGDGFAWCEVGEDRRFDLRQGTCDKSDLSADVLAAAEERRGFIPSYVGWPLS
jgi:hypothetical protein